MAQNLKEFRVPNMKNKNKLEVRMAMSWEKFDKTVGLELTICIKNPCQEQSIHSKGFDNFTGIQICH